MPLPREWPVVFRPQIGEVLSSWIVRIAGVYPLDPRTLAVEHLGWPADALMETDLGPSERILNEISRLTRLNQNTVERHTVLGANPGWLPDWVTLRTPAVALHLNPGQHALILKGFPAFNYNVIVFESWTVVLKRRTN